MLFTAKFRFSVSLKYDSNKLLTPSAGRSKMTPESFRNLCLFHTLDGLRDGLTHFSGSSRAALIYAIKAEDSIRVYDPQHLLKGHEPILKELYLQSNQWRKDVAEDVLKKMHS